ncbi:hypothetical protein [Vibrio sp. 10N]|uniref:hypothetical protein n=1 Tax=Vibrio sp. 10N TaxID=3058938 RepID=UPI002812CEA1|nr:hypothetical protein VB10N_46600 [Vibrio sp. 10N]
MKIKTTLTLMTALVLSGCQSTPEPVEPREFDSNASYAYNIANQTSLMRNDSPLRDFTREEVNDVKAKLTRPSGAEASVVLGSLTILTGNLTGIINVAGGGAAYLANSGHTAANSRFIVVLKKSDFDSKLDAANYIVRVTHQAATQALTYYGKVEIETDDSPFDILTIDGELSGLVTAKDVRAELLQEGHFEVDGEIQEVYTYGVTFGNNDASHLLVTPPSPLLLASTKNEVRFDDFYKRYTKALPSQFYIYTPSFPKARGNKKVYTYPSVIVPAIYTQGKKHEFVKPE